MFATLSKLASDGAVPRQVVKLGRRVESVLKNRGLAAAGAAILALGW
jgi:hypothetical protein